MKALNNEIRDSAGNLNISLGPTGPLMHGIIGNNFQVGVASPNASPFNMTTDDGLGVVLLNFASGTVNLPPTASSSGRRIVFKKIHATQGFINLTPNTGTVDGQSSFGLFAQYDNATLYCNGTDWFVLQSNIKTRWQLKVMTSSVFGSSAQDVTQLQFNNLIVGHSYLVGGHLWYGKGGANQERELTVDYYSAVNGGGTWYYRNQYREPAVVSTLSFYITLTVNFIFTAVSTTLVPRAFTVSNNDFLYGHATDPKRSFLFIQDITQNYVSTTIF
jgi:hypothetical protein